MDFLENSHGCCSIVATNYKMEMGWSIKFPFILCVYFLFLINFQKKLLSCCFAFDIGSYYVILVRPRACHMCALYATMPSLTLFYVYGCFACMCISLYNTCASGSLGGQKGCWVPWKQSYRGGLCLLKEQ